MPITNGLTNPAGVVLIVDDQKELRHLLTQVLTACRIPVVAAANGHEAVEACEKAVSPFSLILMDIRMPGLDGLETLARIRGLGMDSPVIVMTGQSGAYSREDLFAAGVSDVLDKPFMIGEFIGKLKMWINIEFSSGVSAGSIARSAGPEQKESNIQSLGRKGTD